MRTATEPDCYPLLRLKHEHGYDKAVEVVAHVLTQADVACGIEMPRPEVYALWSSMLLTKWKHLSLESLIVAIRDGMASGKVYGKLNLPQINEWLTSMDQRICTLAENEAMERKFTGDNLGKDYLDRAEHDAGKDRRAIEQKDRLIERLREKLSTKDQTSPAA